MLCSLIKLSFGQLTGFNVGSCNFSSWAEVNTNEFSLCKLKTVCYACIS